ncbi:hypothetical protein [Cognaticolwellia mytili]|nr:hypothetical protein [Cognaticolwellia mytili]
MSKRLEVQRSNRLELNYTHGVLMTILSSQYYKIISASINVTA